MEMSARDLADDEWMSKDEVPFEQIADCRKTGSQMFDPNRRVEQDQGRMRGRRRGTERNRGSLPPKAASRRAASRAISACNPARTSAVFSRIPVAWRASSISASSRIMVVRICISMVLSYASVKRATGERKEGARPFAEWAASVGL